jgi:carbonic anhydrase/acetyltransferase-like protein (isoleucine patch superfamily)
MLTNAGPYLTPIPVPCVLRSQLRKTGLLWYNNDDGALIGIGAIVLNGARVGRDALVGAGALVPEGMTIPPCHLAVGVPARVVRELKDKEIERNRGLVRHYVEQAQAYMSANRIG